MDLQLAGKRAVVTGGSRGIGKAIARALAAEGADLALVARTQDTLEETARQIESESGRKVIPIPGDTGDDSSVGRFMAEAADQLGGVDILVNNAAPGGPGNYDLAELTDDLFNRDMNVKVGTFMLLLLVTEHFLLRGDKLRHCASVAVLTS